MANSNPSTPAVRLHQLGPSPNCLKIRLALGYKGIPHEIIDIDPADRSKQIAVSGQPLTPILEHGDTVMFDSAAILRYIDANFRDTGPRLFSEDRDECKAIEGWERAARSIGAPVGSIFGLFFSGEPNDQVCATACRDLNTATAPIEERLADSPWLVGDSATAADILCASYAHCGAIPAELAESGPIAGFFREHLNLGEGRERTRDWIARTMAFGA